MKPDAKPAVSEASFRCSGVIPSVSRESSRDRGWTSLLIDVHTGIEWDRDYKAVTTLDPRLGVSFAGDYLIHFHSKGTWRADVNRPGMTTVLRSEEDRRFRFTKLNGDACQFALVYFPIEQLVAAADHLRRPGERLSIPSFNQAQGHDPAITEVTRAAIRAMQEGANDLYAESVSAWLAVHVLRRKSAFDSGEDTRRIGELSDARLSRVVEFISVHYAEQITLEQLASEACISKYHFTRLFKEKVGRTPHRYLAETRLIAAQKMLISTSLRIGEIAHACGYASVPHFATAFSSRFGSSPTQYRTAHTSRVSSAIERKNSRNVGDI